jgi:hypothetical protein
MGHQAKDQHAELVPMAIAALIAVVCTAALVLLDVGFDNAQGNADGMITSAVLARAGAVATPSLKPTDIAAPDTVVVRERPER